MTNGEKREAPAAPAPEQAKSPEAANEQRPQPETAPSGAGVRVPSAESPAATAKPEPAVRRSAAPESKDKYRVRVERALEQNLWDLYFALPPGSREKFKAEGEAAAASLRAAIESKNVKPNQVLKPVLRWLRTIPKVNPYFLEQEAKIKVDKVMELMRERREEEGLS